MPVQIVTDIAADLIPDLIASTGVAAAPLQVEIAGQTDRDGVELSPARF